MCFIDVRRHGKLLFRYDPDRSLVEIKPPHGEIEVVDLLIYSSIQLPLALNQELCNNIRELVEHPECRLRAP